MEIALLEQVWADPISTPAVIFSMPSVPKVPDLGTSPGSVLPVPAILQSKARYGKSPGVIYRWVVAIGEHKDYDGPNACVLNDAGRLVFADSLKGFTGIGHG